MTETKQETMTDHVTLSDYELFTKFFKCIKQFKVSFASKLTIIFDNQLFDEFI